MKINKLKKGDKITLFTKDMIDFEAFINPCIIEISSIKDNYVFIDEDTDKISFDELCETYKYMHSDGYLEDIVKELSR